MKSICLFEVMCSYQFGILPLIQTLLHSYRLLDIFSFLYSGNLTLLLCSDILVLRNCVDPMYIFLHLLLSIM